MKNLPKWPSYSFYLNLLENPVAKLENGCLAITNNQFDRLNNSVKNNGQILYNPGVQIAVFNFQYIYNHF
jgi:hypothetical protein